jgi:hypothetical protein
VSEPRTLKLYVYVSPFNEAKEAVAFLFVNCAVTAGFACSSRLALKLATTLPAFAGSGTTELKVIMGGDGQLFVVQSG